MTKWDKRNAGQMICNGSHGINNKVRKSKSNKKNLKKIKIETKICAYE
jgi:hypothetical protein